MPEETKEKGGDDVVILRVSPPLNKRKRAQRRVVTKKSAEYVSDSDSDIVILQSDGPLPPEDFELKWEQEGPPLEPQVLLYRFLHMGQNKSTGCDRGRPGRI